MSSSSPRQHCRKFLLGGLATIAVFTFHSGVSQAAKTCVAPPRAHAVKQNAKAIVWLRKTKEATATRKSYFGCAFSKGKTIRIVWTRRDKDDESENCGGTSLSSITLRGVEVTYNYVLFAGSPRDFRAVNKDRVNLRTGKRKTIVSDERASECA